MFGSMLGLKEMPRREKHCTRRNDGVVCDAIEDHIFAQAGGEVVDGLEGLVRESVEFERGMEGYDGIGTERGWHAVPV